ncbi:DUF3616 domain-containing protein [Fibrobacterota bacterium]
MKKFYTVLALGLIIIIAISLFYKSSSTIFYGIAESREIVVNLENPVEIGKIHVVQGQLIKTGDLLVKLNRPGLTLKINDITHQLNELKVQASLNTGMSRSQINRLKAEQAARINEINSQIEALEAQYRLNQQLTSRLKSIKKPEQEPDVGQESNPLKLRIASLKKELQLALSPTQIQINLLQQGLSSSDNPIRIQIESLENELQLLKAEMQRLTIFSPINGIIGSVNFKDGEKVSPFATILTLHTKSPSYVKGYLHENIYSQVAIGEQVEINSISDKTNRTLGDIVGVGSRIVEYPVRLRKRQDIQIWGREVVIKIPEENGFLLGEKVIITPTGQKGMALQGSSQELVTAREYRASELRIDPFTAQMLELTFEKGLKMPVGLEPSGLLYLDDLKKYLLVSDDTEEQRPLIYIMNSYGHIEKEILIRGLDRIDDMEGITQDRSGNIYIISSQSANKKGTVPAERRLLIKVKRTGYEFELERQVSLYDKLTNASTLYPQQDWAVYLSKALSDTSLDIEGLFCHNQHLYLGCKAPLKQGKAVILEIKQVRQFLSGEGIPPDGIGLWREMDLIDKALGVPSGISDLCWYNNNLYVLSYTGIKQDEAIKRIGNLWVYDLHTNGLQNITALEDLQPEGISFNSDNQQLMVAFDNGRKGPYQIMKLQGLVVQGW